MLAGNGLGITGAASTVARDNLPKNIIVVSNEKGKIAASPISIHELQTSISGGATTIINNDLTPNKVVISNADGKVSTSSVSSTEVGHLAGTTDLIQNQLNSKAPQLTTYTKSEVDQLVDNNLLLKADKSETYTKTEIDNNLLLKANQATTYNKIEVDNKLLNSFQTLSPLLLSSFSDLSDPNNNYIEFSINELGFGNIKCDTLNINDKHSFTDTSVTFGTPVTCQFDLSCGTLTASSIYGGASIQIQQNIDNAIVAAALSAQLPLSINSNVLSIDLSSYATTSSTYTTTVIDDKLLLKANKSTTYTKTEVDDKLLLKANKSTTYTKTEIDDNLLLKANQATTYNKIEVDNKLLNSIRTLSPLLQSTFSDLSDPNNNYIELSINLSSYATTSSTYTKTEIDDKLTHTQPVFTALDPIEEGFDLSDINNPVLTLGIKQSFLDTVNGKQDGIDTNTILDANRLSLSDITKDYINSAGATTRINGIGIQFGNQQGYQASSAQMGAAIHTADTLDIVGMGTAITNRKIKLWAEGGVTLAGSLTTNTHSITDTSVNFGTPVTCQYDLSCGTLTASSIYGGASTQIISAINSAVSTKQDTIDNSTDLNVNTLTSSSNVFINGDILSDHGMSSISVTKTVNNYSTVYYVRLSRAYGGLCGQIFATGSTDGYSSARTYAFAKTYARDVNFVTLCETSPFGGRDFILTANSISNTELDIGVYNNSNHTGIITLTILIGGSINPIQITTL